MTNKTTMVLAFVSLVFASDARAQRSDTTKADTSRRAPVRLGAVEVKAAQAAGSVRAAPDRMGAQLRAGAKSEILSLDGARVNLAEKVPRQVFAKIPGVFVYDMDGSGNQINISTRGLDSHRSWEMNVRQDGVMVNSDIYGYPASHYSAPLEAIERIELVRGTAALQYGAQFGGLVNYVTKQPDTLRAFSFENINSAGSFGLRSSFLMAGGRSGRLTYSAYVSERRSDGYRESATSRAAAQFVSATFRATDALSFRAQVGRSTYRYQIPGPLNDSMFENNPRMATRDRNWFSPDIVVPSLLAEWRPDSATTITAQLSKVIGDRSSVQFVGFADVPDAVGAGGTFGPRQVDIDNFNSLTGELRLAREYSVRGHDATLAAGFSLNDNNLRRRQQGRGSSGADYDLTVAASGFGRDVLYRTGNVALYAENLVRVTNRLTIVPGFRVENGITRMTGRLSYLDPEDVPTEVEHRYPLFGVRSEFALRANAELYGGWSQTYRPMLLKDVLPENALERTDAWLKDARGWTAEAGVRGLLAGRVAYDVTGFVMRYENRFGSLLRTDSAGQPYLFKTNVGSSETRGVEAMFDARVGTIANVTVRAHTATAWFDGFYRAGTVVVNGSNESFAGNRIESVPRLITRSGVTLSAGRASAGALISYTGKSYSDPQNTEVPTVNGARGVVPSYTVIDLNASYAAFSWLQIRGTVGNVLDTQYFTKRPAIYPGPGVWPSDGRSVQLTAVVRR